MTTANPARISSLFKETFSSIYHYKQTAIDKKYFLILAKNSEKLSEIGSLLEISGMESKILLEFRSMLKLIKGSILVLDH